jgi:hypothetical protein
MALLLAVQGFLPTIVLGIPKLVAYWLFLPYLDFNNHIITVNKKSLNAI